MKYDLVVLFEHPEWQKPLWAALERRGVRYAAFDLKRAAFDPDAVPAAALYFKQNPVEPSPIAPSAISPQSWGIGSVDGEDDKSAKDLISNPTAWADKEAAAVLTEIRRDAA